TGARCIWSFFRETGGTTDDLWTRLILPHQDKQGCERPVDAADLLNAASPRDPANIRRRPRSAGGTGRLPFSAVDRHDAAESGSLQRTRRERSARSDLLPRSRSSRKSTPVTIPHPNLNRFARHAIPSGY